MISQLMEGAWNTIKVYTAEDGANFYVIYRYPAKDLIPRPRNSPKSKKNKVKVEIWSSDSPSNFFYSKDNRHRGKPIMLT